MIKPQSTKYMVIGDQNQLHGMCNQLQQPIGCVKYDNYNTAAILRLFTHEYELYLRQNALVLIHRIPQLNKTTSAILKYWYPKIWRPGCSIFS